jgi:hypothetical protein
VQPNPDQPARGAIPSRRGGGHGGGVAVTGKLLAISF